ncbi:hypothetical protein Leryth_014168 [Lithospermum erythrorhizon]|nr:hypothetical protein Leryth_014168 [Lithospermum erythrorhizon]
MIEGVREMKEGSFGVCVFIVEIFGKRKDKSNQERRSLSQNNYLSYSFYPLILLSPPIQSLTFQVHIARCCVQISS